MQLEIACRARPVASQIAAQKHRRVRCFQQSHYPERRFPSRARCLALAPWRRIGASPRLLLRRASFRSSSYAAASAGVLSSGAARVGGERFIGFSATFKFRIHYRPLARGEHVQPMISGGGAAAVSSGSATGASGSAICRSTYPSGRSAFFGFLGSTMRGLRRRGLRWRLRRSLWERRRFLDSLAAAQASLLPRSSPDCARARRPQSQPSPRALPGARARPQLLHHALGRTTRAAAPQLRHPQPRAPAPPPAGTGRTPPDA